MLCSSGSKKLLLEPDELCRSLALLSPPCPLPSLPPIAAHHPKSGTRWRERGGQKWSVVPAEAGWCVLC